VDAGVGVVDDHVSDTLEGDGRHDCSVPVALHVISKDWVAAHALRRSEEDVVHLVVLHDADVVGRF